MYCPHGGPPGSKGNARVPPTPQDYASSWGNTAIWGTAFASAWKGGKGSPTPSGPQVSTGDWEDPQDRPWEYGAFWLALFLVGIGFFFSSFLHLGLPKKMIRWAYLTFRCIMKGPPREYDTRDVSTQTYRDAGQADRITQTRLQSVWTHDIWVTMEG